MQKGDENLKKTAILAKLEKKMKEYEKKGFGSEEKGRTRSEWYFKGKTDGLNEAWKIIKESK